MKSPNYRNKTSNERDDLIQKSALVLGGSGLVGSALIHQLLEHPQYHHIRSISRRSLNLSHPKLMERVISFDQLSHQQNFFSVDEVFCCLGTTMKKAKSKQNFFLVDYQYPIQATKLAKSAGVKQFLIITATGANKHSLFYYSRVKGKVEETLRSIDLPSIHILRPSLILGDRHEFRFGEKMASLLMKPLSPFMIGPLAKYRAIEAKQVARAMIQIASRQQTGYHLYSSDQIQHIARYG